MERAIILNAHEVRAVLNGTKTQHRVALRQRIAGHPTYLTQEETNIEGWYDVFERGSDLDGAGIEEVARPIKSPFGVPGDRLWVREAWAAPVVYNLASPAAIPDWAGAWWKEDAQRPLSESELRWRSPVSMPRWASRITLVVESVRVQRVQDISEEDARAEGVEQCGGFMTTWGFWMNYGRTGPSFKTARDSYRSLWQAKHGADSWSRNDWVFALTFKRVEGK